jgi:hypothetical protein
MGHLFVYFLNLQKSLIILGINESPQNPFRSRNFDIFWAMFRKQQPEFEIPKSNSVGLFPRLVTIFKL